MDITGGPLFLLIFQRTRVGISKSRRRIYYVGHFARHRQLFYSLKQQLRLWWVALWQLFSVSNRTFFIANWAQHYELNAPLWSICTFTYVLHFQLPCTKTVPANKEFSVVSTILLQQGYINNMDYTICIRRDAGYCSTLRMIAAFINNTAIFDPMSYQNSYLNLFTYLLCPWCLDVSFQWVRVGNIKRRLTIDTTK